MSDSQPNDRALQSGTEIYDSLMANIEQDLMSASLPGLEAKYAGETDDQKAARQTRYEAAFAEYDRQFAEYTKLVHEEVYTMKKTAREAAELRDREEEARVEQDLLARMQAA